MKAITPSSPLLTLVVEPNEGSSTKDVLAHFHPIMKSLGYGKFELNDDGFYQASKAGKGAFGSDLYVFAEVSSSSVVINIDGHSVFGLKGVDEHLQKIKSCYESRIGCDAKMVGPDYLNAFIGNLLYTALPIYTSAAMIILFMLALGGFQRSTIFNVFLYATFGVVGAKTRFWINQRKKQRAVWQSVLILLFAAPAIFGTVILVIWLISRTF
jgi:hypothetical protein